METGLKIKVGADLKELDQALDQSTKKTKRFAESVSKGVKVAGFDDLTQKLKAVPSSANAANAALVDLGRVAQDLPYGFIGISNNLNPLFESFARLRKEAGSTGGAFSLLLGSVKGIGGIGLAISVLSSAMTIFQNGMSAWTRGFGNAKKEVKELSGYLGTTKEELDTINGKFADEASRVTVLVNALRKGTLSHREIVAAKKELIKISPQYFSNIDKEGTKINDIVKAYTNYNNSLIQSIENQIKVDKLTKAISDRLKVEEKNPLGLKQLQELLRTGKSIDDILGEAAGKSVKDLARSVQAVDGSYTNLGAAARQAGIEQGAVALKGQQENAALTTQLINVARAYKSVQEVLGTIKKVDIKPAGESVKKVVEYIHQGLTPIEIPLRLQNNPNIEVKKIIHHIQELAKSESFGEFNIFEGSDISKQAGKAFFSFKKYWEEQEKKNPLYLDISQIKVTGLNIKNGDFSQFFTEEQKQADAAAELAKRKMEAFANEMGGILKNGFTDALSGVGETIGNIISEGASGLNAFQAVGLALSEVLINVGKAAIGTGLAIEAIKKALASLKGPIAIGAGVALVALGSVIKNRLSKTVPGLASGGIVPPGFANDTFPARLSSGEAVIPLDRLDSIMGNNSGTENLVARVSGNDLLFILERTNRSQKRSF